MRVLDILRMSRLDRLDAELLMARLLSRDRSWLLAHGQTELSAEHMHQWQRWEARRLEHEPVAYIVGEKEFYARSFSVNRAVLIPRPSTEGLIDVTRAFLESGRRIVREVDTGIVAVATALHVRSSQRSRALHSERCMPTLVDVGTGSGCIAVTLALELPEARIIATDCSREALKVARANAKRHGVENRIQFLYGNLLKPITGMHPRASSGLSLPEQAPGNQTIDFASNGEASGLLVRRSRAKRGEVGLSKIKEPFLIISNPPYIPQGEVLPREIREYEPADALFAGERGLDVITPLIAAARADPLCRGIILECRRDQLLSLDLATKARR